MDSRAAVELFVARLRPEEGERMLPYDDATGRPVAAPQGKITWGWGFNLQQCGSRALFEVMGRFLVTALAAELQRFAWYASLEADPARQSVFLDIAYNEGVGGLLHFPHMLAAVAARDWTTAASECKVADSRLDASRYTPLRSILLTGAAQ